MQPSSRLIGKPVVSADRGEKIGTVADLLIDAGRGCAVGLVIDGGFLKREHVLPYEEVQMLGRDVIIARSGRGMLDPSAWKQRDGSAKRAARLKNVRVITRAGRDVGRLSDFYLDDRGAIAAYDLTQSDFGGIVQHHANLPHTSDIALGEDAMVVPEAAADVLERSQDQAESSARRSAEPRITRDKPEA